MMFVRLWTDILVWLLVAAIAAYFVHVCRQPHLLIPWRRVTQSAYGMSALVVIVAFVANLLHAGQGGSRRTVAAGAPPIGDRTPDACWKWGLFYVNPADPSILIETRFGIGYTVNLGNRWTWIVLSLLLVPIVIGAMVLR